MNKIGWEDGAAVTEEDIIASLKPLVDEYFFGETAEKAGLTRSGQKEKPHRRRTKK